MVYRSCLCLCLIFSTSVCNATKLDLPTPCLKLMTISKTQPIHEERLDPSSEAKREALHVLSQNMPSLFTLYLKEVLNENPEITEGAAIWNLLKSKIQSTNAPTDDHKWLLKLTQIEEENPQARQLLESLFEEVAKHRNIFEDKKNQPTLKLATMKDFNGDPWVLATPYMFSTFTTLILGPIITHLLIPAPVLAGFLITWLELNVAALAYLQKKEVLLIPLKKRIIENRHRRKLYQKQLAEFANSKKALLETINNLEIQDSDWMERQARRITARIQENGKPLLPHESSTIEPPRRPIELRGNPSDAILRDFWLETGEKLLTPLAEYIMDLSRILEQGRPQLFSKDLIQALSHLNTLSEAVEIWNQDQMFQLLPLVKDVGIKAGNELQLLEEENQLLQRIRSIGIDVINSRPRSVQNSSIISLNIASADKPSHEHLEMGLGLLDKADLLITMQIKALSSLKSQLESLQTLLLIPPTSDGSVNSEVRKNLSSIFKGIQNALHAE